MLATVNVPVVKIREVPLSSKLTAFFGAGMQQFGWSFFAFGMIFVFAFGIEANLSALVHFRGEMSRVDGVVVSVAKTRYSEGNRASKPGKSRGKTVFECRYTFDSDGQSYTGSSFSKVQGYAEGQRVQIEFPVGKPGASRIVGMRATPFGHGVLMVMLFPFVGLCFVVPGLFSGRKNLRLMVRGVLAKGKLISKVKMDVQIDSKFVYRLTFQYTDQKGALHQVQTRTHHPAKLEDDAEEYLLYDADRPSQVVFVDALPGTPILGKNGRFSPVKFGSMSARVLPPLVAACVVMIGVILRSIR